MNIIYTADWHIKLGQRNVPIEWQKNRFYMLFDKLNNLECDLLVIGGDIFDKLPSLEELSLFYDFVAGCNHKTIIYDGNHEATKKGKTFLTLLASHVKKINPKVDIITSYTTIDNIDIVPYCELHKIESIKPIGNILMTHVRGEIPPHVKPEIDLDILNKWDIVLAGDLHSHSNTQRNIVYPGSPVTTSFHRNEVNTGVISFNTETLQYKFIQLDLPQLIKKKVSNPEEIVESGFHRVVYEVEGNVLDLATLDTSNTLIDKKIVKKETEKTLDLGNKSISEELKLYLEKILKLDNSQVLDIVELFNDSTKEINME